MPDGTLPAEDAPSLRGLMRRAAGLERRGAFDAASVVYRDVLRRFPGNTRARAGLTAIEATPPRLPRARTAKDSVALAALVAASKARRHDEVIALAPALIEVYPDTALLHSTYGAALSAQGRGGEALRHLRHAFRLRPDHAEGAYNLGVALQAMKRWSEAISAYATAVERDPGNADALNNLGAVFMTLGDYPSAFTAFDRAVAARPDLVEAWNNRGHARQNLGDIAGAIADFEAALKRDPGHVKVYFNIGHALKLIGQGDGARACLWEVLKLDPTEARAARELATMAKGEEAADLEKLVAAMLGSGTAP